MKHPHRLLPVTFSGLVSHLESRLAAPPSPRRPWRRWLAYAAALEAVETGRSFYRLRFVADPTGVARELLDLRDGLRMAGWDGQPVAGAPTLSAIAPAERDRASFEGMPDRIERLLARIAEPRLPEEITITELPREPLALRLVEALETRGVRVRVEPRETISACADLTTLRLALALLFSNRDPREFLALPVSPLPQSLAEALPVGGARWREAITRLRDEDELARGRVALWLEGPTWDAEEGAPRAAVVDVASRVESWARDTGQISLALAAAEAAAYARESRLPRFSAAAVRRLLRDCAGGALEPSLVSADERRLIFATLK